MEAGTLGVQKILLDVTQFTSYPLNSHHYTMMLALLYFNSNKHRMTVKCVCVCVCLCERECESSCVYVCNLISASGPMALVCLHPKSKLCNYDDRPVLFISHLSPLSFSFSLFLSFSLSVSVSVSPSKKTATGLMKRLPFPLTQITLHPSVLG